MKIDYLSRLGQYFKLKDDDSSVIVLTRGAIGSFSVHIVSTALAVGVQIFLTKVMGVEFYGDYSYVITWINFLALISMMGFDSTILRYVAAYSAVGKWSALHGILCRSRSFVSALSFVISGLMALIIYFLLDRLGSNLVQSFYIGCALLPILSILGIRQAVLRGLRHVVKAQTINGICRPIVFAAIVAIYYLVFRQRITGHVVLLFNLLGATTTLVVIEICLRHDLPSQVRTTERIFYNHEWVCVALPLLFVSGMNLLQKQSDIMIIGAILGTWEVGIYTVVSRVATLAGFGLGAINAILAPMIAQKYARGQREDLQRLVTFASRCAFSFALFVVTTLFLFGDLALGVFGTDFIEGYSALRILLVAQLVNAFTGPVGFLMIMTTYQKEAAWIVAVCAVLNIVLNLLLIPLYGINGAAFATAFTFTIWNMVLYFFVRKRLCIHSAIFSESRVSI
ncbi:polysaccharide biosynthesis C-terminal domain-containing protein [bacterium]|nr:polysaccharide biosynthesis C-terminal domain-containing protein [bacterium]